MVVAIVDKTIVNKFKKTTLYPKKPILSRPQPMKTKI